MSKDPIEYLKHIADECSYLISAGQDLSKDEFSDNETLKRAVVRSLEIIGEATKKIPETLNLNGKPYIEKIWPVCGIG